MNCVELLLCGCCNVMLACAATVERKAYPAAANILCCCSLSLWYCDTACSDGYGGGGVVNVVALCSCHCRAVVSGLSSVTFIIDNGCLVMLGVL